MARLCTLIISFCFFVCFSDEIVAYHSGPDEAGRFITIVGGGKTTSKVVILVKAGVYDGDNLQLAHLFEHLVVYRLKHLVCSDNLCELSFKAQTRGNQTIYNISIDNSNLGDLIKGVRSILNDPVFSLAEIKQGLESVNVETQTKHTNVNFNSSNTFMFCAYSSKYDCSKYKEKMPNLINPEEISEKISSFGEKFYRWPNVVVVVESQRFAHEMGISKSEENGRARSNSVSTKSKFLMSSTSVGPMSADFSIVRSNAVNELGLNDNELTIVLPTRYKDAYTLGAIEIVMLTGRDNELKKRLIDLGYVINGRVNPWLCIGYGEFDCVGLTYTLTELGENNINEIVSLVVSYVKIHDVASFAKKYADKNVQFFDLYQKAFEDIFYTPPTKKSDDFISQGVFVFYHVTDNHKADLVKSRVKVESAYKYRSIQDTADIYSSTVSLSDDYTWSGSSLEFNAAPKEAELINFKSFINVDNVVFKSGDESIFSIYIKSDVKVTGLSISEKTILTKLFVYSCRDVGDPQIKLGGDSALFYFMGGGIDVEDVSRCINNFLNVNVSDALLKKTVGIHNVNVDIYRLIGSYEKFKGSVDSLLFHGLDVNDSKVTGANYNIIKEKLASYRSLVGTHVIAHLEHEQNIERIAQQFFRALSFGDPKHGRPPSVGLLKSEHVFELCHRSVAMPVLESHISYQSPSVNAADMSAAIYVIENPESHIINANLNAYIHNRFSELLGEFDKFSYYDLSVQVKFLGGSAFFEFYVNHNKMNYEISESILRYAIENIDLDFRTLASAGVLSKENTYSELEGYLMNNSSIRNVDTLNLLPTASSLKLASKLFFSSKGVSEMKPAGVSNVLTFEEYNNKSKRRLLNTCSQ